MGKQLDLHCTEHAVALARVYNKEGGRVSYSSIVRGTAVVGVQARSMIFTTCGVSQFTLRAQQV